MLLAEEIYSYRHAVIHIGVRQQLKTQRLNEIFKIWIMVVTMNENILATFEKVQRKQLANTVSLRINRKVVTYGSTSLSFSVPVSDLFMYL